ncbi:unnamed protein product [Calicophoron daubneyi]|uniref:Mesoderm induction early response protein 1 n=1 Tax=Calicophoron daubneyi TaxID=300641 RepID=A0AAV2TL14_CALDB
MSDNTHSDTASDSEYDEHDHTVEEDDDSIAADEDATDEEEINNLMKESQMSLDELLATYGVPASEIPKISITSQPPDSSGAPVSGRSRRQAVRRAASPVPTPDGDIRSATDENISVTAVKRPRRSNSASVLNPGEGATSSPPPNSEKIAQDTESVKTKELTVETLNQPTTHSHHSSPQQASALNPRRRAVSLSATPDKHESTPKALDESTEIEHSSSDIQHSPLETGELHSETSKADEPEGVGTKDTDAEEGEESRDSTHDETYSSRFWQRAIAAGESPPSYNSDEDEDYAPSPDSGRDWRGEIRVGDDYQARVPSSCSAPDEVTDSWETCRFENESCKLWQPDKLSEDDVIHFERLFAETLVFPLPNARTVDDEEALYLLMRCNYDTDEALQRLRFRTVSPSEIPGYLEAWSQADSTAFEKGFALYSKDFRQIRETRLRHKTVGELVHYYYLWKKTARHDEFTRNYRKEKKKPPHPNITSRFFVG